MEVINMDPAVQQQLTKLVSVRLCPPVTGQILLDAVVNRPEPGDPSYQQFSQVSPEEAGGQGGAPDPELPLDAIEGRPQLTAFCSATAQSYEDRSEKSEVTQILVLTTVAASTRDQNSVAGQPARICKSSSVPSQPTFDKRSHPRFNCNASLNDHGEKKRRW